MLQIPLKHARWLHLGCLIWSTLLLGLVFPAQLEMHEDITEALIIPAALCVNVMFHLFRFTDAITAYKRSLLPLVTGSSFIRAHMTCPLCGTTHRLDLTFSLTAPAPYLTYICPHTRKPFKVATLLEVKIEYATIDKAKTRHGLVVLNGGAENGSS